MEELSLEELKEAFVKVGSLLKGIDEESDGLFSKVTSANPWFTTDNLFFAFSSWADALNPEQLNTWLKPYHEKLTAKRLPKTVGVVNAGNIPLVGFHDLLSVLVSGNKYLGKNSSDDPYLLPFLAEKLIEIQPKIKERISFTEKLSNFDAVIATGSNNSARYFEYYFGKYPHIIRMNRNGVAVLTGDENEADLKNLGRDIFQYFGLGCRNVSKLFVPENYDFKILFEAVESFSGVSQHHT
jgi:hypothetical protein